MNTKVIIEVVDDKPFNVGWLLYLLGQPRPEGPDDPEPGTDPTREAMDASFRVDGWDMGKDTPTVGLLRRVFEGSESAYVVTVGEPIEDEPIPVAPRRQKEPVTE